MPHRYRQRDAVFPQRRHPSLRAQEAGRLNLWEALRARWPGGPAAAAAGGADIARLAATGMAVRARLLDHPGARPLGGHRADLFTVPGFATSAECAALIAVMESRLAPSPLYHDGGGRPAGGAAGSGVRTSSTHYFGDHPLALTLGQRIDALLGLARQHAEPLQGQRYRPGEEYRHHRDHFRTDRDHWQREKRRGGQRSWTAMLYLNGVEDGGATDFPRLALRIQPRPGLLVAWNNMARNGRPNPHLLHAGTLVLRGTKYVATQWYRIDPWQPSAG